LTIHHNLFLNSQYFHFLDNKSLQNNKLQYQSKVWFVKKIIQIFYIFANEGSLGKNVIKST